MNLGSGGKQRVLRSGMLPNGDEQGMVFADDYPNEELRGNQDLLAGARSLKGRLETAMCR
jgi:hypothetical protein